jgi:hypothetical protein
MAELTIRLRIDPASGKKEVVISLRSDEDALPHEHEQQHKALVEKLIEGGLAKAGDKIVVEREEEQKGPATPGGKEQQTERQAQKQGR